MWGALIHPFAMEVCKLAKVTNVINCVNVGASMWKSLGSANGANIRFSHRKLHAAALTTLSCAAALESDHISLLLKCILINKLVNQCKDTIHALRCKNMLLEFTMPFSNDMV